jgi:hypothetical protein
VTDAGVTALFQLPRLTELDIRNCTGVTKTGIQPLAGKDSLRVLKIGGTGIDDSVLGVVATLKQLTGLALDNCSITDAGIAQLDGLPLADLSLYQCAKVTDEGLSFLAGYDNLQRLSLGDVAAKGSALALLPAPEKLLSLKMAQSQITDQHVVHLARFTNLATLNLSETAITDAAVQTLARLTSLKDLTMTQTGVSREGITRLREALPDCAMRSE